MQARVHTTGNNRVRWAPEWAQPQPVMRYRGEHDDGFLLHHEVRAGQKSFDPMKRKIRPGWGLDQGLAVPRQLRVVQVCITACAGGSFKVTRSLLPDKFVGVQMAVGRGLDAEAAEVELRRVEGRVHREDEAMRTDRLEGVVELPHRNVQVTVTSTVKQLAQVMGEACAVVHIKLVA
ncbi:hypothetical protein EYF80_020520 [Liparis tanakae]|uniref:Uncharacterized protein n=1 Tax=Liparis tanakae TaxID=230148 RepID=A0A4Z2HW57_9TELE|nr:hypothetical protein EYF80_020520 [Liparis tanakae]